MKRIVLRPALVGALGLAVASACIGAEADLASDDLGDTSDALTFTPIPFPTPDAYDVANRVNGLVARRADKSGAQVLGADFDGDDRMDLAIVGHAGWTDVMLALSRGDGTFTVENKDAATFAELSARAGVTAVAGDFNRDGRADIALTGGAGWTSIPIWMSSPGLGHTMTNYWVSSFPEWSRRAGARMHAGDFNGDGCDDLLLIGGTTWSTVPVAFSRCDGRFDVTNVSTQVAVWARESTVQVAIGDFDDNGQDDIALTGGGTWTTIPVGLSNGEGGFRALARPIPNFARWARTSGARLRAGDSNGDGKDDLLLVGGSGWTTVPEALSRGDGSFSEANPRVDSVAAWAQVAHVTAVVGDHDRDGLADITLTGATSWTTVPVARRRRISLTIPPLPAEQGVASDVEIPCSERPSDVDKAIDLLCEVMPWCDHPPATCTRYRRELAAGTTLYRDREEWNGFGGHGEHVANAGLCLLKDLEDGALSAHASAGGTSAKQEVGFHRFDREARSVTGYQTVELCGPYIGCLGMPPQTFTATVRKSSPANPRGTAAGDLDTRDSYGLEIVADEIVQGFSIEVPPIPIITPWGEVSISPRLTYDATLAAVDHADGGWARKDSFLGRGAVWFRDLYGRTAAVEFADDTEPRTTTGWWSQLGLGSRDARPDGALWNGANERPDMDMDTARWAKEHTPTHALHADVDIRYAPTGLLPDWVLENFDVTFEVYTILAVDARAAGQVAIGMGQGYYADPDHDRQRSSVQIRQGVTAAQYVTAEVGFHLRLAYSVFGYELEWEWNPSTVVPLSPKSGADEGPLAWADVSADPAAPIYYDEIRTLHGDALDDVSGAKFVGSCLAADSTTESLPEATYTPPDDPTELSIPYACNVCVGSQANPHGKPVGSELVCPGGGACPVTARGDDAAGTWECKLSTVGCFDVCLEEEDGVTRVIKTAAQIDPAGCADRPK